MLSWSAPAWRAWHARATWSRRARRYGCLEAGDAVGGRMRTDRQAGFVLDRGFQVFNTSYPQVRRRIDLRALQLRPFTPGMLLHTSRGGSGSPTRPGSRGAPPRP